MVEEADGLERLTKGNGHGIGVKRMGEPWRSRRFCFMGAPK